MQDRGFTGAAVSEWERGASKINVQDRDVLIALIKVLYEHGGIKTHQDANGLLESGDYRALNQQEAGAVFGEIPPAASVEQPVLEGESPQSFPSFLLEKLFSLSDAQLRSLLAKAEEGPPPSWPRVLAVFLRKTAERISLAPKNVFWIGIWWIAWWLIAPSLRWPFADRTVALQAIGMYVAGTLIIPLLIGLLIDTKQNTYWQAQGLAHSRLLRLYTYQGAGIGFNLGYFFVLPVVLIRYYLNLGWSNWPAVIAVTLGLILANMSARVIPHNLWLAYSRLHFKDGGIFFLVAFLGPLWGIFFLEYYPVLLQPVWGSVVILVALLCFILIPLGRAKKMIDTERAQP